jgi:hypothetical protein
MRPTVIYLRPYNRHKGVNDVTIRYSDVGNADEVEEDETVGLRQVIV